MTPRAKLVYLFELDSVRKTDEELIAGQRALYSELVSKGNCVVLTYNQFADSRAFFSLMDDEDYCNSIIRLFKHRVLRLSQFGDIRPLSNIYCIPWKITNSLFIRHFL